MTTKTNSQLKQDIEAELRWDPKLDSAKIGVTVDGGAVTLRGNVDTFAQKFAAEDAARRVSGVRAVAQDLTVKVLDAHKHSDSEIAAAIQTALSWDVLIPDSITATVQNGAVSLQGHALWNYQRESAERAVRNLTGVTSVYDGVELRTPLMPMGAKSNEVREKIEAALKRQATDDANAIHVETVGGKVTLSGKASSWRNIAGASSAAWSAPGVTQVIDQMLVSG